MVQYPYKVGILVLPLEQVRVVVELITARGLIIISNFLQVGKLSSPRSLLLFLLISTESQNVWGCMGRLGNIQSTSSLTCLVNFLFHLGQL